MFMNKKPTKAKVIVAILIIAALSFGVYNLMWLRHVKKFDAFLDSEKLKEIKQTPPKPVVYPDNVEIPYYRYEFIDFGDGFKAHKYNDYDIDQAFDGFCSYFILIPPYLSFDGSIQVRCETDEYALWLRIVPKDWRYTVEISENVIVASGGMITNCIGVISLDKDGRLLERQKYHKTEEFYNESILAYDIYKEQIDELFATVKETFGDALG